MRTLRIFVVLGSLVVMLRPPFLPGPTLQALSHLLLKCDDEIVKMNVAEAAMSLTRFRDGCQQALDQ
eukprot:5034329-Amphidinium_carterae.1